MIGIICAMPEEQEAVTSRMEHVSKRYIAHMNFYHGWLAGQEAVVCLCGVGKVNAAMSATLLCQLYQPALLINLGVAGGLLQEQEVGDFVFSDKLVQADFDTSAIDGEEGVGKAFDADTLLLTIAIQAAENLGLRWRQGTVATQDIFMARKEDYEKLMEHFPESACSEMEGAAIAQVAKNFSIPFLAVRALSDVAVHEDNPMEFSAFAEESSKKAGALLESIVQIRSGK